MRNLIHDKIGASSNKTIVTLLSVVVAVFVIGMVYFIYDSETQQEFIGACETNADCSAGYECINSACEKIIVSTLKGKAATISVFAYDKASNTPSTTKTVVPLYLVQNPTVTATKVTGEDFAADGTDLSSSSRTDVTEGLTVGDKFVAIAANGSYYGAWSSIITIDKQAKNLDLDNWAIATNGGDIELKDEGENVIANGEGGTNLTLGASETESFYYLKIKNNNTNSAWNVAGFFIDKAANSNITTFSGEGTTTENYAVSYAKDGTFGLERTDADDVMFTLATPVMLLEYDQIKFNDLQVRADGDGCAAVDSGEAFSIYVFDKAWFRSSKENAMMYGAETDSDSPVDVGANDYSETHYCDAGA